MAERRYDLVLFGATGFVGELTAQYLARHAPADCEWALAGRNHAKLVAVRERLVELNPALTALPLIQVDATDRVALRSVAASTRVLASTVGPYVLHGEPLVAACAAAGTDYLDLTGEPEFVDTMYLRHHERAVENGARLVHCCGFDSIPHDLGAYFTVRQLPEDVAISVSGYVQASAAVSGGTLHSVITGFSRGRQNLSAHRQRAAAERPPAGRRARAVLGTIHRISAVHTWAVPLPTIDPQVIVRSALAVDRYGPDFRYSHFAAVRRLPTVVGGVLAAATLIGLAQLPVMRRLLLRRIKPGEGPSAARRARSWFRVTFVGEGGGHRVITRVCGGDPGYDETATMLAEAALALAFDDLPPTAGQVTPVEAMGDALLHRLQQAGLVFEVLAS